MNNIIKEVIKGIKGLNLRTDTGKVRVREYSEGEEKTLGQGDTLSEALVKLKGHHWIGDNNPDGFGFIYRVIDTKERKAYIGRKQRKYYSKDTQSYSIVTQWESYSGSCIPLNEAYVERPEDFVFYKLLECNNRDEMGYAEHFLIQEVFGAKQVTGEYEYYNRVLPKLYMGQMEGVTEEFKEVVYGLRDRL